VYLSVYSPRLMGSREIRLLTNTTSAFFSSVIPVRTLQIPYRYDSEATAIVPSPSCLLDGKALHLVET